MTEEQIFKNRFPEYCVGEKCLSPYFDLFQTGFEEGEKRQLTKAKELLRKFLEAKSIEETCVAESEAEQFLKEVSE